MMRESIRRDWHNFVFSYKRRKLHLGNKRTGRGGLRKATWTHEEQMSRFLDDDPSVTPGVVRSSMPNHRLDQDENNENLSQNTSDHTSTDLQLQLQRPQPLLGPAG